MRIGLQRFILLSSAAVVGLMASGAALAEDSSEASQSGEQIETVVATGQRPLSRAPQAAKLESTAIVDSVGAVEIQQLTDTTVVDVLSRVPGVAVQRGYQTQKSWYANIRGLDGNYNSVDIDGGIFIDSTRNDREAYLDTVPSYAVNEVIVSKTVTPDMDPNSIGGHISMLTLRSFDLDGKPLYRGSVAADLFVQDGAPTSHGPSISGNVVAKDTFGPAANFGFVFAASLHNDHSSERYNNEAAYANTNGIDIPSGAFEHGNFDLYDHGFSMLAKVEARSTDKFYSFLALNFFKEDMSQLNYRGSMAMNAALVTNTAEGTGSFTGATAQAYSRRYDINRQVLTLTGGLDYALNDSSKASVVASYGNSDHNETLWGGSIFKYSGLSGSYSLNRTGADFSLTSSSGLSNSSNWIVTPSSASVITHLPMTDDVYTAKADYSYNNFGFSRGVGFSGGVAARRLHRVFNQSADNYTLPAGTVYSLDKALADGAPSGFDGTKVVYVDFRKFWSYVTTNGSNAPTTTPTSSYALTEDVLGAYGALYYTTERLKTLAGVRYEYTSEDDTTAQLQGSTPVPYHFTHDYGYLLPNVQASYSFDGGYRARAAFTKTIARPTFTTFAQGLTINNFSSLTPFIRGSNSNLEARESTNYDAALEWYGADGYVSVGAFYKDIDHEVYYLYETKSDPGTGAVSQIVMPHNAGSSLIKGIEVTGEWRDFSSLLPALEGLAVRANYTWLQGKLGIVNQDGTHRTIDGLGFQPDYEANVVLAYDRDQYAGSLSYTLRGRAFNGTVGTIAAGDGYIAAKDSLDMRLAYRPLDYLEIFVNARNLTRSAWREVSGIDQKQPLAAIQDGISFELGFQLKN